LRPVILFVMIPALCVAAEPLGIVKPIVSQMEDGVTDPSGFEYTQGQTFYFTCRVANYAKDQDYKIHLSYSVQAFDPQGVPISQVYKNEISDEITPRDKDWMPKIGTEIAIPPLAPSGTYKIAVEVQDLVAKTSAKLDVPFRVRGRSVEPSEQLIVRDFRFFADENAADPMDKPVYHPGKTVWAKFDIIGFKYGAGNKIDVSYSTSLITSTGKVLWTQPQPAAEQTESFYPKRYVAADFGINLANNIRPGEYTIAVSVKDAIGNQTYECKQTFVVE
jgi:hypothetical protein